jgi:hypothetical protein
MEYPKVRLYIQIKDGQPFQHPIPHENFVLAFPDIDPDNLPADRFAKFVRTPPQVLGAYEVLKTNTPAYELVDGVVKDAWNVRQMTDEEKAAKQQKVKDDWAARPQAQNWAAWTFDEASCAYVPPIPRPDPVPGKKVVWCGAENNWKEAPPPPKSDGKRYKFDFFAWEWVEVVNVPA